MNFDQLVDARMNGKLLYHPKRGGVYRLLECIEGKLPSGAWVTGFVYQDVDSLTKYWRGSDFFGKFSLWEGGC